MLIDQGNLQIRIQLPVMYGVLPDSRLCNVAASSCGGLNSIATIGSQKVVWDQYFRVKLSPH